MITLAIVAKYAYALEFPDRVIIDGEILLILRKHLPDHLCDHGSVILLALGMLDEFVIVELLPTDSVLVVAM